LTVLAARKRHSKAVAESDERLTNLVLKEHDDGDADVEQRPTQNKCKCSQVLSYGDRVKEGKRSDRGGHGSGAGSTNEFQNCIHKQEDKNDIRDIARLTKPSQVLRVWQY
jgi:hypothetical protein